MIGLENEFEYGDGYLPKSLRKPASIDLTGWKLDEFYQMLGTEGIEYEDKRSETRGKGIVHAGTGKPSVRLTIRKTKLSKGNPKEFHGITVSCRLPKLLYGVETAYYLEQNQLLKVPEEFFKKIRLLGETTGEENTMFRIGRNHLADFYYTVLPQLEDAVEIFEEDSDEIKKYLPPQGKLLYYLDAEDGRLLCRAGVRYGTQEYDARESIENRMLEPFRERTREQEAVYLVSLWFPDFDEKTREYYCSDEEKIYEFLTQGLEMLLQSGEVHCTARFRNLKADRKVKMSMGISISQGLLNLDISSGDISAEEMEEILGSYRAKKKYHRLKNGSFLSIEDENVATLEELTKALRMSVGELLQKEVHLPLYRALYLDKLLEQKEEIYANRDSHFRELVKNFKTVQDSDFEEPPQLKQVLRGYQSFGYRWLRTLEEYRMGGILADDMGLGKTLQAIAVLSAAKQEGRKGTSLIVAPASLVFNWGEELNRFAPELSVELITGTQTERSNSLKHFGRTDVFVTSYDLLKRDIAEYHGKQFEYQIIDEAQYIKNHSTAAAKAVKAIESKTRFALTGTPIENRLSELWSIFDFLMPGYLYGYEVFRREFESPIVREADEAAMERLKKMTAPFILRRLKEQVLKDLPEKLEEHRYVRLSGEQKRLYEAQVQRLKQSIAMQDAEEFQKNKLQVLAEITKIRQLCCDPSLCYENYQGESAKKEACMELIQSAMEGGHRMLVFSQFTSMLELLQKELTERQIAYYTITGDVPKEKRLQLVREFNEGDVPVFLISLKAGGVGLNLTGADVVIHYDPWWNLAVQNQATDRAHRIGQTKKVVVYKLLVKDSMEEKIQKLQESKKQLSDQIVGETANQLSSMSKEEFLALFE
ncbi:MAG: DEAD/DEAH box helicase [Lachnospiraceae bacterium]